jgi:3-phosphoshikimate 1-carboxyvinyltransferase
MLSGEPMTTVTFTAGTPLRGTVRVPGDKSISHRSLLLAALAEGTSTISGLSQGEDVLATKAAMQHCGAVMTEQHGAITVIGGRSLLHEPAAVIDIGNAGTGMRLLAGWAAAMPWLTVIAGDASLHKRDMGRVVDPLRQMGAKIDGRHEGRLAPLTIRGGNLTGITYDSLAGTAQSKSAVLLAGLAAEGETIVHESVPARAHTEEMLKQYGADIESVTNADGTVTTKLRRSVIQPFDIDVPADPSQATFWLVAASLVEGSDVVIENVYIGPHRGGAVAVLQRMGADIEINKRSDTTADLRVRSAELTATDIVPSEVPSLIDELPILSVAAAVAKGVTTVTGAEEMRAKESDRIAAVAKEVGGLGALIEERPDGFVITGKPGCFEGGTVDSDLDHRIAMTGAIAALVAADPVAVHGWETVASSYPTFLDDLSSLQDSDSPAAGEQP